MRRRLIGLGAAIAVLAGGVDARAETQISHTRPVGTIVGDRPTAVVVVDGSGGTVASWSARRGGGRAPNDWTCRYHSFTLAGGTSFQVTIDLTSAPVLEVGYQYALVCVDDAGTRTYESVITWDPADPFSGLAVEDRLADQALAALDLPLPAPRTSPPLTADQLVGLDTWLWLDTWAPVTATATLGGVAATVEATPTTVRWDLGDGTVRTCAGPGRPWQPDDTGDGACRHTWVQASAAAPGGTFPVTATVAWHVTWRSTTGATGDLGTLTSVATAAARVVEAQAVIGY